MGKGFLRSWLSIVATISLVAAIAPGAAAEGTEQPSCEPVPGDDWCEGWVATYGTDRNLTSGAIPGGGGTAAVLSPAGDQLFVVGTSWEYDDDDEGVSVVTAAFDTTTATPSWEARYPAGRPGFSPGGIAVSPDGSTVYVVATRSRS